jgi:cyclohexanone monooxygenase
MTMASSRSDEPDLEKVREVYRAERAKRLRADGNAQFSTATGAFREFHHDFYADAGFKRDAMHETVEVLIIGGGIGGLVAGANLRKRGVESVRIVEKGAQFGGTWYWNRYPGAQCDVESYIYLPLLEDLGYVPTERYAHQPEILSHLVAAGKHFGLEERALFQTEVTDVRWDDEASEWLVATDRADVLRARFVIVAAGDQHTPRLPAIPGIESFEGRSFHTSRWDREYAGDDLSGLRDKRVGVIGTGATGLQVVPGIADAVQQLLVFQRTPSTVAPRDNAPTDPEWASRLGPGWHRKRMNNFTAFVTGADMSEDDVKDSWTRILGKLNRAAATGPDPDVAAEVADYEVMEEVRQRVDAIVRDPQTADALKPYYRFNCKRPGYHDEYLDTFNKPNVTLVDTHGRGVDRIVAEGAVVDGELYEVDCLIFATGFDVGSGYTHARGFDPVGRGGLRLSEKWDDGMKTYQGFHTRSFPNLFFIGLTQTGLTVNIAHALTEQAEHLAFLIAALRERELTVVEASEDAETAWVDEIRAGLIPQLPFLRECTPSWFNNEGQPEDPRRLQAGRYPGGAVKFFALLDEWRRDGSFAGLEVSGAREPAGSVG